MKSSESDELLVRLSKLVCELFQLERITMSEYGSANSTYLGSELIVNGG